MAKTWKERLIKEERKLDKKVDALRAFIEEDEYFDTLPESDRDLLMAQHAAMTAYFNILTMRMKKLGLKECECEEVQLPGDKLENLLAIVDKIIEAGKSKRQKEDEEDGRNS